MKMPSSTGMQHRFSQVPAVAMERSAFDRSHSHKTMFDPDYLIPHFIDEVLPGDTFNLDCTNFIRMTSALNVPIMDNMYLDTFYFFVPNRLLWYHWEKFMGAQDNPADSISFTKPQIVADASTGFVVGSLSDYFGLPTGVNSLSVDSQFHRAYNLIWNKWFRDENIQNSVQDDTQTDGPDTITNYVLLRRGKRHDYFTSCLPFAQKGTAVGVGLTGTAPIIGLGVDSRNYTHAGQAVYETDGTATVTYGYSKHIQATTDENLYAKGDAASSGKLNIYANLGAASAISINSLRLAFQTQKMLERDARGGTRYTELVKSHFGVTSPDARLQRPEFLGGKSSPITISTVPQTSATNSQPTPQGNLSAFALGTNARDGFTKSFTEHGIIMGLCMVRADLTYQQGLPRMFSRSTRLDYYFPSLAHLGEQAVLTKEIYCDGSGNDALVFGYQERFAEYRYYPGKITGKLRSTYSTPLDVWHLAQKFTSYPTLSDTFIKETMPIARIEAVTSEPAFVMDSFIKVKAVRPMPAYSVPGLIDHF